MDGLYLLWKPQGPGSQECLRQLKIDLGLPARNREGIGHTGTLDPFAEGLLLVGVGEGTKLIPPLNGLPKTYEARMLLGVTSRELDVTGELSFGVTNGSQLPELNADFLADPNAWLQAHLGPQMQRPPEFSAVRVEGQRSYDLARKGQAVELKERQVNLISGRHLKLEKSELQGRSVWAWDFEITVSSGTYIRALARDWGLSLIGEAGLLSGLKRTAIGDFRFPNAQPGAHHLLSPAELRSAFDLKDISERQAQEIQSFGRYTPSPTVRPQLLLNPNGEVVAWTQAPGGQLGRVLKKNPA